jgi:2-polyprenyl-3-methyl-5-hydroxy-6-metoxy-1,4-benzoquinol methylase
MDAGRFRTYQKEVIERFQQILDSHPQGSCNEQGLPSYTNPNPLMRWLIWKRVNVLLSTMDAMPLEGSQVLDFGCGYGLFLPFLITKALHTTAYDLNVDEISEMGKANGWKKISYLDQWSKLATLTDNFDLILASEVLEHVENLEETIQVFKDILSAKGALLVAGPTENFLYKIGRQLAGYSGEYHVRNIDHIKGVLDKYFAVRHLATILPLVPFYKIVICTKK